MSFIPDLGMRYLDAGHGERVVHFRRAPIRDLVQIEQKALTCTTTIEMEVSYAVYLDFEGPVVDELLALYPQLGEAVRVIINLPFDSPRQIDLPTVHADLATRLGAAEENDNERYVPFKVQSVTAPSTVAAIEID